MMLDIPMFWIGPLGGLMPIACPEPGLTNSLVFKAAENQALNGRITRDLQGVRREWSFTEAYLDPEDVAFFESLATHVIKPPFRIVDPLRKNRLLPSVASPSRASYLSNGYDSWYVYGGSTYPDRSMDTPYVEYTTEGDQRTVRYRPSNCLRVRLNSDGSTVFTNGMLRHWDSATPSNSEVYLDAIDPRGGGLIVNEGEQYVLSLTVNVISGTVEAGVYGVDQSAHLSSSTSVTLSTTGWQTTSMDVIMPSSELGVTPYFRAVGGAAEFCVGYMQLEAGNVATSWEPGFGVPECDIVQFNLASPRYPLTTAQIKVKEL